jgi:hypothetical protein
MRKIHNFAPKGKDVFDGFEESKNLFTEVCIKYFTATVRGEPKVYPELAEGNHERSYGFALRPFDKLRAG